jgi:hypothetical protein
MELTYITIVILSSMVFVLAAMVGYLYWQQTKMMQHLQSLSVVISTQLVRHEPEPEPEPEHEPELETEALPDSESEDDRVSVEEKVEHVEGPPEEVDVDDLQLKSVSELKELLTKKGIPFGKRDSKTVLLQLMKASS